MLRRDGGRKSRLDGFRYEGRGRKSRLDVFRHEGRGGKSRLGGFRNVSRGKKSRLGAFRGPEVLELSAEQRKRLARPEHVAWEVA